MLLPPTKQSFLNILLQKHMGCEMCHYSLGGKIFSNALLHVAVPLQLKTLILKRGFGTKNEEKLDYRVLIAVEFQKPCFQRAPGKGPAFLTELLSHLFQLNGIC